MTDSIPSPKISRRGFFGLCAAAGFATLAATTRLADVAKALVPQWLILYGDGVHDDTDALQVFIDGEEVSRPDGSIVKSLNLPAGCYAISNTIDIQRPVSIIGSRFEFDRPVNSYVKMSHDAGAFISHSQFYGPAAEYGVFVDTPPNHHLDNLSFTSNYPMVGIERL